MERMECDEMLQYNIVIRFPLFQATLIYLRETPYTYIILIIVGVEGVKPVHIRPGGEGFYRVTVFLTE